MDSLTLDGSENAVYVATASEAELFDENIYTGYDYGLYVVLLPYHLY